MSDSTQNKTSEGSSKGNEEFSVTGIPPGTGANALGTSAASGDMGNEASKIDRTTGGIGHAGTTTASSATVAHDNGTR